MGKTKTKRSKCKKPCPTGLPSVQDIELEEENLETNNDSPPSAIQLILEKLQSPNVEDKECGCFTVGNLIAEQKDEAIKLIVEYNIIKILASHLVDKSALVRHAAAGTLRNLSVVGGHDICDIMVDQDIMTPLVSLFQQYSTTWTPSPRKKKPHRVDSHTEIFIEATNLLWNLCESSSTVVRIFNKEKLLTPLIYCLNPITHGSVVAIAVAHCLHTVTEDNSELSEEIRDAPAMMETIKALLAVDEDSADAQLLRVLGCGILVNINEGKISSCPLPLMTSIMELLSRTLDTDVMIPIRQLCGLLNQHKAQKDVGKDEKADGTQDDDDISRLKGSIENLLSSQTIALENLTNICCSEDSADDWDDMDSSDASDEIFTDACMGEGDIIMEKLPLTVASEIHEAVIRHNLLQKALGKVLPPEIDVITALKYDLIDGTTILNRLASLHCRALLCVHNIIDCLDHEELGGAVTIHNIWRSLAKLAFQHTYMCAPNQENVNYCGSVEHLEFLEASTSAMRIIIRKLAELNTNIIGDFTPADLQILYEAALNCREASVRNNIINIMGTLGSNLANSKDVDAPPIIKKIGLFLLEMCTRDAELTIMAEAFDAMFDVFAEDHLDPIVQEIGLVEKLRPLLPIFKNQIHQQRHTLGPNYPVVMTAKTNLARFIQYKTQQALKNGQK